MFWQSTRWQNADRKKLWLKWEQIKHRHKVYVHKVSKWCCDQYDIRWLNSLIEYIEYRILNRHNWSMSWSRFHSPIEWLLVCYCNLWNTLVLFFWTWVEIYFLLDNASQFTFQKIKRGCHRNLLLYIWLIHTVEDYEYPLENIYIWCIFVYFWFL